MNKLIKNDLIFFLLVFGALVLVDQLAKNFSIDFSSTVQNRGIIFGALKSLSPFIRVSLVSSFFGIIFFLYIIAIYLLSDNNRKLKYALTFIVGGIGGNVLSKVVKASTIDFIPLNIFSHKIIFNLADIFLWIGVILALIQVIYYKSISYENDKRISFIVSKKEQFVFSFKLCLICFSTCLIIGLFSYSFVNSFYRNHEMSLQITWYLVTLSLLIILFMLIVFVVGIIVSHRFTGPHIAFSNYVDSVLDGNTRSFRLRKSDYFKELEKVADKLLNRLK